MLQRRTSIFYVLLFMWFLSNALVSMDRTVQLLSAIAMAESELVARNCRSCMGTMSPKNEGENYAFVRTIIIYNKIFFKGPHFSSHNFGTYPFSIVAHYGQPARKEPFVKSSLALQLLRLKSSLSCRGFHLASSENRDK